MKDVKKVFRQLEKMLENSSWFDEGWEIYNRGTYLHLYKETWHNHNQGGIHFETYIEGLQIQKKSFPVCMHAEEDTPYQSEFIKMFLEQEKDKIRSWKGYKLGGTNYGICERILPLHYKNLEQRIYEEFNRLRKLESGVEQVLNELNKGEFR